MSFLRARPLAATIITKSKWAAEEIVRTPDLITLSSEPAWSMARGDHIVGPPESMRSTRSAFLLWSA